MPDYPLAFQDVWDVEACAIAWPPGVDSTCATEGATVALSPEDRATADMAL